MATKHYYIESREVDKMRSDKITPVRSVQFDLLPSGDIYINIDQPNGKDLIRASVIVPIEEIENALNWLKEND